MANQTNLSKKDKKIVSNANTALMQCRDALRGYKPAAFGPQLGGISGSELADAVVSHRFIKNLDPAGLSPTGRREHAISNMLKYDEEGLTAFDYRTLPQPFRGKFLEARAWLHKNFSRVPRSHVFRPPSGESVTTNRGDVDWLSKLQDPVHWAVSLEASYEAAAVCYHNNALKRVVRDRFRKGRDDWHSFVTEYHRQGLKPFAIFHRMFVDCCTISAVSRLSSVRKNAGTDRVISMEAFWTMVAQLSYAADLRSVLRQKVGVDLDSRADLHRSLIRLAQKATIDFSNASNSNWIVVLRELLPKAMYDKLMSLRTPTVYADTTEYAKHYAHLNMLAPMGCGFTFEVMTIVLLALSRAFDPGSTVFGDDVIIDRGVATDFTTLATLCGWKINETKSFIEGNFRESCGGFYDLKKDQYIISYDFHEVEDMHSLCTTGNKLRHLLVSRQVGPDVRKALLRLYCKIVKLVPSDAFRHRSDCLSELPDGVLIVPDGFATYATENEVCRLASTYLHRQVAVGRAWSIRLDTSRPKVMDVNTPLYRAAYLRRGCTYAPEDRQSKRCVYGTKVIGSEHGLAAIPLLSVL